MAKEATDGRPHLQTQLDEKPINGNRRCGSKADLRKPPYDVVSLSSSSSSSSSDEEYGNPDVIDFGDITIPYKTIYEEKDEKAEYFLVGVPVRVEIVEKIHQPASHRFNPFLYTIEVTNGKHQWRIQRRYNHFRHLHRHLEIFRASVVVQHPTMVTRFGSVPKFPYRPDFTILSEKSREKMKRRLQKFLQNVVKHDRLRNCTATLDFLEVSHLSFIDQLGGKRKEGEVLKKAGGHAFPKGIFRSVKLHWHKRWLVVKDNFVTYVDKEENVIRDVLLFDKLFTVSCDENVTGMDHGLLIKNDARNLLVKCSSGRQAREWITTIVNMMGGLGKEWIGEHRFDSFAPIRKNSLIKWYIDGADYFSDVADAIANAEEEIFITDWWLSPELSMKRPAEAVNKWRLDLLLKERAEHGVKVFVLLYKEVGMALTINSAYTKKILSMQHEKNIQVLRHPNHVASGNATLYWAHHEKIVCVDQTVAFLGGLDLCYGRWDDHTHRLFDFGSAKPNFVSKTGQGILNLSKLLLDDVAINSAYHREQLQKMSEGEAKIFVGKDYSNPYVKDIAEVEKPFTDLIDRSSVQRMPWHDIGCMVVGNAARDVARHFIQRWNFTKNEKAKEMSHIPFLLPKVTPLSSEEYHGPIDRHTNCEVQILRSGSSWSTGGQITENSIYDAYIEAIRKAKYYVYIENQFFITSLPDDCIENKIGDALVERILTAFNNDEKFRVYIVMPLLPCFPGEIGQVSGTALCFIEHWNLKSIRKILQRLKTHGIEDASEYITVNGLRTHADLPGKMVTEIVYVHSKLLIVDDKIAIIGSANVNDRSMLGCRDSEIAIYVQDNAMIPGVMNNIQVDVGRFCATLRRKLFQEHLGLLNEPCANVLDPISDEFFKNGWQGRAKVNTEIYEQVFPCLPCNEVKSFAQLERFKSTPRLNASDPVKARGLFNELRGYLVEKPIEFLVEQDLRPPTFSNESIAPVKVFT